MRYLLILSVLLAPLTAHADVEDRVGRLERTIELLQRKLLAQGTNSPIPTSPSSGDSASYELRISALEEQMRDLRGMIERIEYRQQKQEIEMQKLSEDVEYRFQQLSPQAASVAPIAPTDDDDAARVISPATTAREAAIFEPATAAAKAAATAQRSGAFSTPREHYDHAFKLLGSGDYSGASNSFGEFVQNYPADNLVGNAYYWLGETHYVRSDYVRAAEQFRLGFEKMPKGPKANDNLLKLAMSLSQIEKEKEACVVLKQLTKPSKTISETIRRRATAESDRIECK